MATLACSVNLWHDTLAKRYVARTEHCRDQSLNEHRSVLQARVATSSQLPLSHRFGLCRSNQTVQPLLRGIIWRVSSNSLSIQIPHAAAAGAEGDRDGNRGISESHRRRPRRIDDDRPRIPIHPDWPPFDSFVDASIPDCRWRPRRKLPEIKRIFLPLGHCLSSNTKNVRSDGSISQFEFVSEEGRDAK